MTVRLLTIPEVAERLSVSRRTVYNYIKGGIRYKGAWALEYTRLPSGEMRVSTIQLKRFLKENEGRQHNENRSASVKCPSCGHIVNIPSDCGFVINVPLKQVAH